jgi:hypothetical protein
MLRFGAGTSCLAIQAGVRITALDLLGFASRRRRPPVGPAWAWHRTLTDETRTSVIRLAQIFYVRLTHSWTGATLACPRRIQ